MEKVWNVKNGDKVLLLNANTGLFAGKPKYAWSLSRDQSDLMVPAVSDQDQYQIFTIHTVSAMAAITTDTLFDVIVTDNDAENRNYYLHTPPLTAGEIALAPPLPVTLVNTEPVSSLHTQWLFKPAYPPQIDRNDAVLHYGMPIFIVTGVERRYLRLDDQKRYLAVHQVPITAEEMDPWIIVPIFDIYVCINAKARQCHYLHGTGTSHAMMTCRYANQNQNPNVVECFDDEGHHIYTTPEECQKECRWPSFQCSGPPQYQCVLQDISSDEKASDGTDYDACVEKCISPQLQKVYQETVQEHLARLESKASGQGRIDYFSWIILLFASMLSFGILVVWVYRLAKRNALSN